MYLNLVCQTMKIFKVCNLSRFIMKCQHDNEERMRRLERYRTETGKRKRVQRKINRAEEQELRLVIHGKVSSFFKEYLVNDWSR